MTIVLPEKLLYPAEKSEIALEFVGDVVYKVYYLDDYKNAAEKFGRELKAFEFFDKSNVAFVPTLLGHGSEEGMFWLATKNAGKTLTEFLADQVSNSDLEKIFSQINEIDKWLYLNRVNYLESSPNDILVDETGNIRIIDFEYTFLHERFEQLLIERLKHDRIRKLSQEKQEKVIRFSKKFKKDSYHFLLRKCINSLVLRIGSSRVQKSIRPR